jgi:predicted MFS family arabinose efflux permease
MPKNMVTAVLFSIGLGMTGDATVSPTSGLVSENFSVSKVATLIGILFFTHQIGAFFSAWLGGVLRQALGGYTAIWMLDVVLCVFACIMSLRIKSGNKGRE